VNNFSISSRMAQDIAIMTPRGYINDVGAERLEKTSEKFLGDGLKKLIVNFAEVQYINTIGISIFTGIVHKTMEHNSLLCFTNLKKIHLDIFEMVGLTKHVMVFKDEKNALSYLNGRT
jgi:anti-anti-sigma factor